MIIKAKTGKKLLALLLSAVLVCALLPVAALAATHIVSNAGQLQTALALAQDGDVIQLGASFTYTNNIVLTKDVTFNVGAYTLTVFPQEGTPLEVDGAALGLTGTTGALNLTLNTGLYGLYVHNGGEATVTNIRKENVGAGDSVRLDGGTATVTGNISATSGVALRVLDGTAQVGGNVTASNNYGLGVLAYGGEVTVNGAVSAAGLKCYGVRASGGRVTVSGGVSADGQESYGVYVENSGTEVHVNGVSVQGESSRGIGVTGGTATAGAVTARGVNSAGIAAGSGTVTAASVAAADQDSKGVSFHEGDVTVTGDISATGAGSRGVYATGAGSLTAGSVTASGIGAACTGIYAQAGVTTVSGAVSVLGDGSVGVYARVSGTEVSAGSVLAQGAGSVGVRAEAQGRVDVTGAASGAGGTGIYASHPGTLVTAGSAAASGAGSIAARAAAQGTVQVSGIVAAEGESCEGVHTEGGGAVTAGGVSVSGPASAGVCTTTSGDSVTVGTPDTAGSIHAEGDYCRGVSKQAGTVTVYGDITAGDASEGYENCTGVFSSLGQTFAANVAAEGGGAVGADLNNSSLTAQSVAATGDDAVGVKTGGSTVAHVNTIFAEGAGSVGVYAAGESQIYVERSITAPVYISLAGVEKGPGDFTTPTTREYCRTYTDDSATVWVRIWHTVTFLVDGDPYAERTAAEGTAIGVANMPADPVKADFTFYCWLDSLGSWFDGYSTVLEDVTLSPEWFVSHTVAFDPNGGSCSTASALTGVSGRLSSLPTPTWSGHGFAGWFTEAAGGTEVTTETDFTADATVYAHWTEAPGTYVVSFDPNGGSCSTVSASTNASGKLAALPTATWSGHDFGGWFTSAIGGTQVTVDTVFSADTTIYAHWTETPVTYTVTFNPNGGSCSTASAVTGVSGKLTSLPTPTWGGFDFGGWFTSAIGGTEVTTDTVFSADTTIYAHWAATPVAYTVTFNPNGGSCATASALTDDAGQLASLPTPTWGGFDFGGWFTEAAGGTQVTTDTVFAADATVYAHWTEVPSGGGGEESSPVFTITASAGAGGSMSPSGTVSVTKGQSVTFTITAGAGYKIADVLADGASVGAVGAYTFVNVKTNHTLSAVFSKRVAFEDVSETDWFYDEVLYVAERGIMRGTSDKLFSPGFPTGRAMLVTMLYRLENEPDASGSGFSDVPGDTWYSDAVGWAAGNGIVSGYGGGLFGPEDRVTREQAAVILFNYARYKGYDTAVSAELSGFSDAPQVSGWASGAMRWAVGFGIIAGKGNMTLDPQGAATRAEIAAIFMRFCEIFRP